MGAEDLLENEYFIGASDFDIPWVQFVEARVFTVMSSDEKHLNLDSAGPNKSFFLDQPGEEFQKYIHNGSPLVNLEPFDPEYDMCLFLCAMNIYNM